MALATTPKTLRTSFKDLEKKPPSAGIHPIRGFVFFEELCQASSSGGFSQSWIFNMRVSERLGSLVFIQKHFFPKNPAAIQGELQLTGFHPQT